MGIFSKKQTEGGEIVSPKNLVKFWISFSTNLLYSVERNAKNAGLDMFGNPITKQGVFGVPKNHMLVIILNPLHENNLLSANVSYPLSRSEASSLIVRLGPLWITSIYDTYKNNLYKLPLGVDALEVILAAFPSVGALVKALDSMARIPESNSEEMEKALRRSISLLNDTK